MRPPIKPAGKKRKGKRLEHKFAKMIRRKGLDPKAKRMVLSGGDWAFPSDIYTNLPFMFECKNQERVSFWAWWDQAKAQEKIHKPAILVFSGNYRPVMVAMEGDTFLNLLLELKEYKELWRGYKKDE